MYVRRKTYRKYRESHNSKHRADFKFTCFTARAQRGKYIGSLGNGPATYIARTETCRDNLKSQAWFLLGGKAKASQTERTQLLHDTKTMVFSTSMPSQLYLT